MIWKVTVLEDITIRAHIRGQTPQRVGDQIFMRPSESQQWISLRKGEVQSGLGLIMGVHPKCVPNEQAIRVDGVSLVMTGSWSKEDLLGNSLVSTGWKSKALVDRGMPRNAKSEGLSFQCFLTSLCALHHFLCPFFIRECSWCRKDAETSLPVR
jgi:hypothetical protein